MQGEKPDSPIDFQGLIEQSPAGVYVLDGDRFLYANRRMAEILGTGDPSALIGQCFADFAVPADQESLRNQIRASLSTQGGSQAIEFDAICGPHGVVRLGTQLSVRAGTGKIVLFGMLQDISEKRRMALKIEQHESQIKTSMLQTIDVILGLSDIRDPYTVGHERRVGLIAKAIAQHIGMDEDWQEGVCIAGYLHDVGKVGVPAEILAKPGRLSKPEYLLVQEHPGKGESILQSVDFPWPVAAAVGQHHERMDGSGYPRGLSGDAILLEARIIAVADVLESMTSHRPYRPAMGLGKALEELHQGAGRLYEPLAVDACVKLISDRHPAFLSLLPA